MKYCVYGIYQNGGNSGIINRCAELLGIFDTREEAERLAENQAIAWDDIEIEEE